MRKTFAIFLLFFLGVRLAAAQSLFQLPIVPDSIQTLSDRCDYLAEHYWDYCEPKQAMGHREKLSDELSTYLNILINADADKAVKGVEGLTKKFGKDAGDLLFLTTQAERMLYGDSAATWVDELYIPFLEAAIGHKKIDKANKARFQHQLTTLANSLPGRVAPSLPLKLGDGTKGNLDDFNAQALVIFFNDPDCDECRLARMRLDADILTNQLIDKGIVKVVSLSLGEPWPDSPSRWVNAANEDADLTFDLRGETPQFYVLDRDHKIRFKHLDADQVLDIMRQLGTR